MNKWAVCGPLSHVFDIPAAEGLVLQAYSYALHVSTIRFRWCLPPNHIRSELITLTVLGGDYKLRSRILCSRIPPSCSCLSDFIHALFRSAGNS